MAKRPSWEGHLRLSLVTCPVGLYRATQGGEAVHFNLLHRSTLNRVHQFYRDAETEEEVPRAEMVRGFAVERDRYVVVEDAELAALKLESTKIIDIERFVPATAIDRVYWEDPFYLVPEGRAAQEPFAVIREAMGEAGQVAIGRIVLSARERPVAIEVRDRGMLLTTLRTQDEVVSASELFAGIEEVKVAPKMVDIARAIIGQSAGEFDTSEFQDRYAQAVRQLIARKDQGQPAIEAPAAAPEGNVIDLMEALRRSLKGSSRETTAPDRKAARTDQKLGRKAAPAIAAPPPKRAAAPRRKAG